MIHTYECRETPGLAADFGRCPGLRGRSRPAQSIPVLTLVAMFAPLCAVKAATESDTRPPDQMYGEYCSVCHGERGDGDSHARQGLVPPPRDFSDPALAAQLSYERMFAAIRDGRPGTAMVAWGSILSAAEIDELVKYISENFVATTASGNNTGVFLYRENCSVCHGDDGSGAIWGQSSLARPPRNFRSERARLELTPDRMIAVVTYGLAGTPMPGFRTQLSQEQIESIVDFITTEFLQRSATDRASIVAGATGSKADHLLALPDGLQGNAEAGKTYYLANCVPCHGVSGGGDGPRAYFIFPRPRNFRDPASRAYFNRPTLFYGIKNGVVGKEMPAWGKVMTDQQIADIAEYVLREFID